MSEIRQMVVSLTMETGSAQQNLRGLFGAVRMANAAFAEASAGVAGFEDSTVGMKAKVEQLSQTLSAQKKIAETYAKAVDDAGKRLTDAAGKQAGLSKAVKDAESAYKSSVAAKGKDAEETQQLSAALDKARVAYQNNEKAMIKAANSISANEAKQKQANAYVKQTEKALADATKRLNEYGGAWKDAMRKASEVSKEFSDKAVAVGRGMSRAITMPIVGLGTAATKAAIDWDTAWVGVQKTVNGTEEQMQALRDGLMGLGGELPSTLTDLAGVAESAGQLGIKRDNILSFTRVMTNLGNATNLTAQDAATAAAQFANIYQMNQADFERWGSAVVELGNNYATTERDIVEMSMRIAAAGKQAKMSEADTLALATALSSLGLEAEGGGSAVSKVLMDMGIAVDKGGRQLNAFAKISGTSAKEFAAQWKTDPAKALDGFIQGLGRIEREGGNVALTLQNMGYNERRLLDALQRLTGAGDIFTRTLESSSSAWRENVALTRESEQRNNSLAGVLQRTKNRITAAAVEIGEKLTPYIRQATDMVVGLVEGFRNLDPAVQANIMKWAGIAAAVGPAILVLGKLAGSISMITKLLAGPAGWAVLGVSAVAAVGIAMSDIKTPAEQLRDSLRSIEFKVDQVDVEKIKSGIDAGIAAADKEHAINVAVNLEMASLGDDLDAALANGDINKKERSSLKKQLNTLIKADVDEAQKELATSVESYRSTLNRLVGDDGQPLFDEEAKNNLITEFTTRTNTLIADLEGYQTEYNALIDTIYNQKEPATAAQMAQLDALLAQIGVVRGEIKKAQDEAVSASRGFYERTVAGHGGGQVTGQALAYVNQKYTNESSAISTAAAEHRIELEKLRKLAPEGSLEFVKLSNAIQKNIDDETAALAVAREKWQTELGLLVEGEVKRTGADLGELGDLQEYADGLSALSKSLKDAAIDFGGDFVPESTIQNLKDEVKRLGEAVELPEDAKLALDKFLAIEKPSPIDVAVLQQQIQPIVDAAGEALKSELGKVAENTDFNSTMQVIFDNVDINKIDTSTATGVFADVLKKMDITGQMGEAGSGGGGQMVTGLVTALGAGEDQAYAAGYSLAQAVDRGMKAGAQIQSPSKKARWNASMIIGGFIKELLSGLPELSKIGAQLGAVAIPRYVPQVAYAGASVGGSRTLNANTTNNFQNVILNNELDAQALAAQLEGDRRRRVAGYGHVLRSR